MNVGKHTALRTLFLPLLLLLLGILLFFHKIAFSNLILARGDTFLYFYPYWHAAAEALRAGRIPLWNPAIFMGAPLLANSQMGFFYPLNWPVWLALDTPYALKASILLHVTIAAVGTYFAARKIARIGPSAAVISALAFALGGYLTAQVEHVNQLQGLSWLPWLLLAAAQPRSGTGRAWLRSTLLVALFFALQLLAGHTQTAFISGIALLIWVVAERAGDILNAKAVPAGHTWRWRPFLRALLLIAAGGVMALLLAGIQVLPTLELSRLSSRQGGLPLNEVLSFSLSPLLIPRALMPAYGQTLFSEYVAALPLSILALAVVGAWQWRKRPGVLPALAWIAAAVLLALGAYNPINWLLGRLPVFDLFRVPARWMALYAFGAAFLAGTGWQTMLDFAAGRAVSSGEPGEWKPDRKEIIRPLLGGAALFAVLALWAYAASFLASALPTGAEAPFETPSALTLLGWTSEMGLLLLFFWLFLRRDQGRAGWRMPVVLLAIALAALFISTRLLPYNNLTAPLAYYDLRPSTSRLLVESGDPPQRLLSLSQIFFDLGEQDEIDTIYEDQLPPSAQVDYTVATKQKEVLSPNLPMLYDLASVDGFDGGVLPLKAYTEQMKLILTEGVVTTDGRLREYLDVVPEAEWLDLFNAGFLITDKVGDVWYDGIFFDRQHPYTIEEGRSAGVGFLPDYEATQLQLLASHQPDLVEVVTREGERWEIQPQPQREDLYVAAFPEAASLEAIHVTGCGGIESCVLQALTLVDERDGTFHALVPGEYRLIYSGDVKIYQNLDVLPRAYAVTQWQWVENEDDILPLMRAADMVPRDQAILLAEGDELPQPLKTGVGVADASVTIERYRPEEVIITVEAPQDVMLILSDSLYPGWQAAVDGETAPIFLANNLFRAVFVPAGMHEIQFIYQSRSFFYGLFLTLASLAIVTIIMTGLLLSGRDKSI